MTTYKTAELEGALLDAAVAKAEGFPSFWIDPGDESRNKSCVLGPARAEDSRFDWCPSTAWEQGGPIIEREYIAVVPDGPHAKNGWDAYHDASYSGPDGQVDCDDEIAHGPTLLIAAMRAYVASKFGETVELP